MPLCASARVDARSRFGSGQSPLRRAPPHPENVSTPVRGTAAVIARAVTGGASPASDGGAGVRLGASLAFLAERQVQPGVRQRRGDVVRNRGHLLDLEIGA